MEGEQGRKWLAADSLVEELDPRTDSFRTDRPFYLGTGKTGRREFSYLGRGGVVPRWRNGEVARVSESGGACGGILGFEADGWYRGTAQCFHEWGVSVGGALGSAAILFRWSRILHIVSCSVMKARGFISPARLGQVNGSISKIR